MPYINTASSSSSGPLTLDNTYTDQEAVEDSANFIEDIVPLLEQQSEFEALPKDLQHFLKVMETFTLSVEGVAKVVKSRIYSMAWHPGTAKLLLAAGDRSGSIGTCSVKIYLALRPTMGIFFLDQASGTWMPWMTNITECESTTCTVLLLTGCHSTSTIQRGCYPPATTEMSDNWICNPKYSKRFIPSKELKAIGLHIMSRKMRQLYSFRNVKFDLPVY